MSNPINLSDLGTLIINEKNLPSRSEFNLLTNKYNQFINTVFLDSFGNLVSWVKPSAIASITSLSNIPNIPNNYIFIKDLSTRQRITFTSSVELHSNIIDKMISTIQINVDGVNSDLDLTTSGIVINTVDKTIDFNYRASSLSNHYIIVKLRNINLIDIGSVIKTNYSISVQSSQITQIGFPNIITTIKNSPHDSKDVTVGQTLSMTSTFSNNIDSNMIPTVIINDGFTNINAVASISGSTLNYSFTVSNDSDHSGIITLNYANVLENTYTWSSAGLLTAANDIYTFPNIVSYDGTSNGYGSGYNLKVDKSSNLILTIIGGDKLHSNVYASQVSSITYKTGVSGTLVTVPSSDVTIYLDVSETITLANIVATEIDDVYFYVTLKGPDNPNITNLLTFTIPSIEVKPNLPEYTSILSSLVYSLNISYWDTSILNSDSQVTLSTDKHGNTKGAIKVQSSSLNAFGKNLAFYLDYTTYSNNSVTIEIITKGKGKFARTISGNTHVTTDIKLVDATLSLDNENQVSYSDWTTAYPNNSTLMYTLYGLDSSITNYYILSTYVADFKNHNNSSRYFQLPFGWGSIGNIYVANNLFGMTGRTGIPVNSSNLTPKMDYSKIVGNGMIAFSFQLYAGATTNGNWGVSYMLGTKNYGAMQAISPGTVLSSSYQNINNKTLANIRAGWLSNDGNTTIDFAAHTIHARTTEFTEAEMKELNQSFINFFELTEQETYQ